MGFLREAQLDNDFGAFVVCQKNLGFIPNLLRAQSLLPRVIEAQAILENAVCVQDGGISRVQKRRMLLSLAAARHEPYCMALDSNMLASLGVSKSQVDDLLSNHASAELSTADNCLLEFCRKLSTDALGVNSEDIEVLRDCGFGDESIIEAVAATALAVYRCTLSVGLAPEPDFGQRELASKVIADPGALEPRRSLRGTHQALQTKGPYVRAPYMNPKTFEPFAILLRTHGFIPNFFRSQTLRADLLAAEAEAVSKILLPEDILTRLQKECILLAVSAANLNSYCVAVHCNMLRGLGLPSEEGDQIAVNHHESGLSQSDKALLDFAVKLGARSSEFSGEDIASLRNVGFSEEQILECVVVTALNNFANVLQLGLGIEPDFEPPVAFQKNKVNLFEGVSTRMVGDSVARTSTTAMEDPDVDMVAKAQSGDLDAFEVLVRRHTQMIFRTLVGILGNREEAQDALQDALFSAFKYIAGFQGRSKFSTWLVSIARNAALQRLRGRKNEESLDEAAYDDNQEFRPRQVRAWQDNPEELHSHSEIRQLVEKAITDLPEKYRVVLILRDVEHLSTDEVARQLGLSVPAVKTRLLRARLMLRESLSPHFARSSKGAAQ
jgi:RNA polymerase sigma-70 factor (ECF subfamily)